MQTGDTVRDDRGASYEVGRLLGRGSWARTYAARHAESGHPVVIKVALTADDLGGSEALGRATQTIMGEQIRLAEAFKGSEHPTLPAFLASIAEPPAAVFEWGGLPLVERASSAASTADLLSLAQKAVDTLGRLSTELRCHGNLVPGNLLVDDRGAVRLTDPATPTLRRHQADLHELAKRSDYLLAPELRGLAAPWPLSTPADTWAVCLQLTLALTVGQERFGSIPAEGLDKAQRVALKDQLLNRLRKEPSNPGFHNRLVDRLLALLNRALSRETSPSPPYRFRGLKELSDRIGEVRGLIHPTIHHVGRMNWSLKAGADAFPTDEDVRFTINIGCSTGVESRDELATGIAVFDAETDTRLRQVPCAYSVDRHPSGRFRFQFKLSDLPPGRYRVRVAFTIRDSGDEPATIEGEAWVRAAPGWVPPRETPRPAPIPLERDRDHTAVTEPGVAARASQPPPADPTSEAPTVALAPTPIAPSRTLQLGSGSSRQPEAPARQSSPGIDLPPRRTAPPRAAPTSATAPRPSAPTPQVSPAPSPVAAAPPRPRVSAERPAPAARPTTPPAVSSGEGRPTRASVEPPASGPDDLPAVDPSFPVMGSWTDLPVPTEVGEDPLGSPDPADAPTRVQSAHHDAHPTDDLGPVGTFVARLVELVKSDLYYQIMAVALVVIACLIIALIAV